MGWVELFAILLPLAFTAGALLLTLMIGRGIERRHLRDLARREEELASIMHTDLRSLPAHWNIAHAELVDGSVVIAVDYFKSFVASLRNLFGGRVRSLETLVERGRREAILRMLEMARDMGANAVWNIRLETATIQGRRQNSFGGVEVVAYGTALRVDS